jgi:ribonuclease BN (tRNA processing enzyme)
MPTELVLLGTAGAPLPVAGRRGICSALVIDDRVFLVDCGRGAPSAFADAGLDFARLTAIFLSHLHADHCGDLPGMLLYPWGVRAGPDGPLDPVRVYGPPAPAELPEGTGSYQRISTMHPDWPAPGTSDLVDAIVAGYAYHLNVMPLDARMPDPAALVRATDIRIGAGPAGVCADDGVRVTAAPVRHGHAVPALAYRFDTADGSVVFSGDTTVSEDLAAFAAGADILVHHVADLGYLARHGFSATELAYLAGLHTDVTDVGGVAERAGVGELILTHYLPAEPAAISAADWARRAGQGFRGRTTAGFDGLRVTLPRSPAARAG